MPQRKLLNRDDLVRLIEENGGNAWNLDLSEVVFVEGIDLSGLNLDGVVLRDADVSSVRTPGTWAGVDLVGKGLALPCYFQGCSFSSADLAGANLQSARLEEADFQRANLKGTDFRGAYLAGVRLRNADFDTSTRFENIHWGDYILGDEKDRRWQEATDVYRRMKNWHIATGKYDEAAEFFYREMTAKRKVYWWGSEWGWPLKDLFHSKHLWRHLLLFLIPRSPFQWAWSMLVNVLCGYGERPFRVLTAVVSIVLGLSLLYSNMGTLTPNTFAHCLYYSAVSFTALGYGSWAPQPVGWVKGIGVFEAFVGVFMMALFLVTFTRKMTR